MNNRFWLALFFAVFGIYCQADSFENVWPDGTTMSTWFSDTVTIKLTDLGKQYCLTDYGIYPDATIQTDKIQGLIDRMASEGGGVLVVPRGVFVSGSLYFHQGVHLHLLEGAVLRGSDNIVDYDLAETRIEGECCKYFNALINAQGLDGFSVTGRGVIDGNGLRFHQAFWLRKRWNPQCTNKDEQRPRLLYCSQCSNVRIEGVRIQNSPFWTTHFYQCRNVRVQGVSFYSLASPKDKRGPSTDAVDLDVVENVVVRNCYMEVNDDAVALKGGKGPWADDATKCKGNGPNRNVLVENCRFGFCHSCLTLGSESVDDRNIVMRHVQVDGAARLLWLKLRPDTPQHYSYVTVEHCSGRVGKGLTIHPWTQFFDLKDRHDMPMSYCDHVSIQHCKLTCPLFEDIESCPEQYNLSDIKLSDNKIVEK